MSEKSQEKDREFVGVSLRRQFVEKLDEWADREQRSRASMLQILAEEAMAAREKKQLISAVA